MKNSILENTLQNKAGVSIFMVLVFMIVASLLGAAMAFMSRNSAEMQGNFYQMRVAEEAAESAVNWFKALVLDHGNDAEIVAWMETFDNSRPVWYSGGSGNWQSMFSATTLQNAAVINLSERQQVGNRGVRTSARLQVVDVDYENSLVTIRAVAQGERGSQRTINAVYRLTGRQEFSSSFTDTTRFLAVQQIEQHAINLQGGSRVGNMNGNLVVDGSVHVSGDAVFNNGSSITGNVKILGGGQTTFNGNVNIGGNTYINNNVVFNVGTNIQSGPNTDFFWVNGRTELNGNSVVNTNSYFAGGFGNINSPLTINGNLYIGTGVQSINSDVRVNGGDLVLDINPQHHNRGFIKNGQMGDVVVRSGYSHFHHFPIHIHDGSNLDRRDNVAIRREDVMQPEDYLPAEQKTIDVDVNRIRNEMVNIDLIRDFTGDQWRDNLVNSPQTFDANLFNQLYRDGSVEMFGRTITFTEEDRMENDGFLVVRVNRAVNDGEWTGTLDAGVRVMLLFDEVTSSSNGRFWESTIDPHSPNNQNSSSLGVVIGTGNIEHFGVNNFRGIYYTNRHQGNYRQLQNFNGSFITNFDGNVNINEGFSGRYDQHAVGAFTSVITVDGRPLADETTFYTEENIVIRNERVHSLFPQLLTKY